MPDTPYTSTSIQSGDKIVQDAIARTYADAGEAASFKRYVFVALALLVLPFLAIFHQSQKVNNGTLIRLPVNIGALQTGQMGQAGQMGEKNTYIATQLFSTVELSTPLNRISTTNLTGHNVFKPGEKVFVFLSPGPNDIWYAYAVSRRAPKSGCYVSSCLILSGRISSVEEDRLNIRYQYEDYIPTPEMTDILARRSYYSENEVFLSVGRNGHTTVRALNIDGQRIDQPNLPIEALFGMIQRIASNAPTK